MIRILIADDHPLLCEGLAGVLSTEADLAVVGAASDGRAAVAEAMRLQPDVIIMDMRMPGLAGPAAIEQILMRAQSAEWVPHILVLTSYEDDDSIATAIESGASGYLLKSATGEEIIAAVRETSLGRAVLAPTVATTLVRQVKAGSSPRVLSPREREVLSCLAEGLTNVEIAARLHVEPTTVKTHVEHVFDKLGVSRRTQAVAKAIESGLV